MKPVNARKLKKQLDRKLPKASVLKRLMVNTILGEVLVARINFSNTDTLVLHHATLGDININVKDIL